MRGDQERLETRLISMYLNEETSSNEMLLRTSKGSDEVKALDLRVLIRYLLLYGLMFRRREDNQDDISEMSD